MFLPHPPDQHDSAIFQPHFLLLELRQ